MWKKEPDQMCPEVHYQRTPGGILVTGCYGTDGDLVLPDEIEGLPVTQIGAYAFAEQKQDDRDEVWFSPDGMEICDRRRICAGEVTSVWLPAYVCDIGRYAFYRCRNLQSLILSDSLKEIGGGALTGCRLSRVEIHFFNGKQSCLKSVLDEIRYAIRADLRYEESGRRVRILFPEHYEEAVENTPARLLVTHHHGAGGYYRQCFYDRELDYKKYDETFFRACAEEDEITTAELVMYRLQDSYELGMEAELRYEEYLKNHMESVCTYLISKEDVEGLRFLSDQNYWSRESMEIALDLAAGAKKTELLSLLMDERRKRYPSNGKKMFEL